MEKKTRGQRRTGASNFLLLGARYGTSRVTPRLGPAGQSPTSPQHARELVVVWLRFSPYHRTSFVLGLCFGPITPWKGQPRVCKLTRGQVACKCAGVWHPVDQNSDIGCAGRRFRFHLKVQDGHYWWIVLTAKQLLTCF